MSIGAGMVVGQMLMHSKEVRSLAWTSLALPGEEGRLVELLVTTSADRSTALYRHNVSVGGFTQSSKVLYKKALANSSPFHHHLHRQ